MTLGGGISSVGRALDCDSRCHRFDPGMSPQQFKHLAQVGSKRESCSRRIVSSRKPAGVRAFLRPGFLSAQLVYQVCRFRSDGEFGR